MAKKPAQKPGKNPAARKKPASRKPAPSRREPEPTPAAADPNHRWTVHVLSDASGNLAGHMTRTVLMGFEGLRAERELHVFQDTPEQIRETIGAIPGGQRVLVHAVMGRLLKRTVEEACAARGIPCLDLTGPLVSFLEKQTGKRASEDVSRIHEISDDYFKRVAAIEFTAEHDDSRNLPSIHEADIVIVGLSRLSKSPTSYLLGSMGFKTANVSIVREVGFPPELDVVRDRTVALTVQPRFLADVRRRRLESSGIHDTAYMDVREVIREVAWAEDAYRERGYPVIDITGHTIEETSAEICRVLGVREQRVDV